jgi:hypothetical protein
VGNFVDKDRALAGKRRPVGCLLVLNASSQTLKPRRINGLRERPECNANHAQKLAQLDEVCISQVLTSIY